MRKKDRRTEVSGTGRQKAGKEGERQSQSETTELTIESFDTTSIDECWAPQPIESNRSSGSVRNARIPVLNVVSCRDWIVERNGSLAEIGER